MEFSFLKPRGDAQRLSLNTLIRLRWLAVSGQLLALLGVSFGLGFDLPLIACLIVVSTSVWLNIFLTTRYPASKRLRETETFGYLTFDIAQLGVLLFLTGGLQNPFAFLLLVPVMVSAVSLKPMHTLQLGVVVLLVAAALVFFHEPMPWFSSDPLSLPPLYVMGIWTALLASMAFMSIYAFRVAEEARQISDALTATELILQREQHLSALDGMAAAAAHELGTPLGTIALVAKELQNEIGPNSPHAEDLKLLREQVQRCRTILSKLTSIGEAGDAHFDALPLTQLIEEVVAPHREFGIVVDVLVEGQGPEPVGRRNPGILYGLGNLVENAVDFARARVSVSARWSGTDIEVEIIDDGPGLADDVQSRLGSPYVTTRGRDTRRGVVSEFNVGLGLGYFIAKTLLERTGGRIMLKNRPRSGVGVDVRVVWPRAALDDAGTAPAVANARQPVAGSPQS